jgi:hypothetical protein
MKRILISIVLASAMFSVGAMAQSSKFTAAYDTDGVLLGSAYVYGADDGDFIDIGYGFASHLGNIKAPGGKELLIGISAVPGLVTFTEAKGKNKAGAAESVALAGVWMRAAYAHVDNLSPDYDAAEVCDTGLTAAPGRVPVSVRLQYLSVDVDLDVVDAAVCTERDDDGFLGDGECIADLLGIEGSVTVALGLATAASHHFNFLAPDLPQSGDYAVAACFGGAALAAIRNNEGGSAFSLAALGKRMMTVQEVRAVKDTDFDVNQ